MAEKIELVNSNLNDVDAIFDLYNIAIEQQKKLFHKHWLGFERSLIETEIQENRQYKILMDGAIACIFAVTFNDPVIWKEKDLQPSIYIHRIVTDPTFKGKGFVKSIVAWAKNFGLANEKQFIRMDTWGDNQKLIDYYIDCGFKFIGLTEVGADDGLPKHYSSLSLSLFEIKINQQIPNK